MQKETSAGLTRRGFMKSGAIAMLGSVAFASAVGTTGCSSEEPTNQDTASGTTETPVASGAAYEVYDADVVVIGSGVSGSQAALQAYAQGAEVIVVEKGPFQFGGVGGMNFDIMMQGEAMNEEGVPKTAFMNQPDLGDPTLYEKSLPYHEWDAPAQYVRQGVSTLRRNADGNIFSRYGDNLDVLFADFGFTRHVTDQIRDKGIVIYDQTMITDFIVQDGVCKGAIGLHIPTGAIRVFRAKAIIKSTGGCVQFYGWKSVSACTTQGGDNTGDTDVAAMRHGSQLLGCEFMRWDTVSSKPDGVAFGYNAAFTCDTTNKGDILDIDGNAFLKDVANRTEFFQVAAQAMADGKANENNSFYADMTPEILAKMRPAYKRNVELWKKIFDIDVEGSRIEIQLQCYEHGGSPRVDENLMVRGIDGLFDVRGGEALGTNGGMAGGNTHRLARYAGVCATEYAKQATGSKGTLDWTLVQQEIERLHEMRTRQVEGGMRPHEIRRKIQAAGYAGLGPAGNAQRYATCIEELKRIIAEDLPKQIVSTKTLVFNTDWKQAIENYSIAYLALGTALAMNAREETRSQFLRTDFPNPDNEYWGKHNVGISLVDGDLVAEAVAVEA